MLLEVYNKRHRQSVTGSKKVNKEEEIINWNKVTQTSLPYVAVTWQWMSKLLAPLANSGVYRLLYNAWNKLQIWIQQREKWIFFKPPEQYQLLKWVQSLVTTRTVNNFKEDWKDGIVLCALIESISPGACPRYDVLHPKQEYLNIELGLRLAECHFGLFSELSVTEIQNMDDGTEKKLQGFVSKLHSVYQLISGMNPKPCCLPLSIRTYELKWEEGIRDHATCFARGMGLLMATEGRAASFNIYMQTFEFMDIVIEIKGRDNDDYCTERITLRSPRKKELNTNPFSTSIIALTNGRIINIPLEYTILSKKIAITYIPPSAGLYELSIISRGQHIFGSPFEVRVDSAPMGTSAPVKPLVDSFLSHQDSDDSDEERENKFPTLFLKKLDTSPHGLVKKRRLIKTTLLREYAMIDLKPGEPLPQDPRAWSALTEPAILLDHVEEVQRDMSAKENCSDGIQLNASDDIEMACRESVEDLGSNATDSLDVIIEPNVEETDNVKFDYQSTPGNGSELNESENHGIESTTSKLDPQERQHETLQDNCEENVNGKTNQPKNILEEDIGIYSNETDKHAHPIEEILPIVQKQSYGFRRTDGFNTCKDIFEQFATNDQKTDSTQALRQDPEGLEGKCNHNYTETENLLHNAQEDPKMKIKPTIKFSYTIFRAPNSKARQENTKGSPLPRVPERLIKEWDTLWTPNGEGIVKARVKEWENIPKM